MTDPAVIAPVTLAMVGGPRTQEPAAERGKIQIPYYEDLEQ
jgi:hypothetical protein